VFVFVFVFVVVVGDVVVGNVVDDADSESDVAESSPWQARPKHARRGTEANFKVRIMALICRGFPGAASMK